jgi:hypothetical protein
MTDTTNTFQPSEALVNLVREVQRMTQLHTKSDLGNFLASIPLFLITLGIVELPFDDKSALKTTPMDDAWLCAAAKYPTASPSALKKLAKDIARDGFVSVAAADQFCTIELLREQKAFEKARTTQPDTSVGTSLLVARINALGIEPTVTEALAVGKEYVTSITSASLGVAGFALEKAIWTGKGLGLVANVLKDLRKS